FRRCSQRTSRWRRQLRSGDLSRGHAHGRAREAVELARVFHQGTVAAFPHTLEDRMHYRLCFGQTRGPPLQQAADIPGLENSDPSTILFSGSSTIPCPPACLSRGMMSRTVDSSKMVFTASHSSSLRCEMVGLFSAGKTASTAARS